MIKPERLKPLDITAIGVPYGKDGDAFPAQRYRDKLKFVTAMEDGSTAYLLLGLESQSNTHYAMPVRNMLYDALEYADQVEKAAKAHKREAEARKKAKEDALTKEHESERKYEAVKEQVEKTDGQISAEDGKKPSAAEYLSGFYRDDKLIPVITLVVLFSSEPWDGPMSLHEMLSVKDESILPFVPDYKINLIAPAGMSDEEINRFRSDLREVMLYIKYSRDKKKLVELVAGDARFKEMDRKAVKVINAVTGSGLKLEESEERVDMCKAIAELREDERREGKAEGRAEGRVEGREYNLIELVCKKIIKGKTIPVIADELEQEESVIEPIYHAALQCAPEYDYEKIYKLLKDGQAQES